MNLLYPTTKKGTVGEIIVQLRFLEHDVQAAPPIKDSGNDLIAIRKQVFRAVQVRTTTRNTISKPKIKINYHILAVVRLPMKDGRYSTRDAEVYLFTRDEVVSQEFSRKLSDHPRKILRQTLIDELFVENVNHQL